MSATHRLSGSEFESGPERAFRSVFAATDPFDAPFTDAVACRAILFPMSYYLTEDEFGSLAGAARIVGDTELYVGFVELQDQPHYVVRSYDEYDSLEHSTELAIYGPSGTWGVIISHEDHGVVGGSPAFFDRLRETFPPGEPFHPPEEPWEPVPFDQQVYEFLRHWKEWRDKGHEYPWLPELLAHVYGEEHARELLVTSGYAMEEGSS